MQLPDVVRDTGPVQGGGDRDQHAPPQQSSRFTCQTYEAFAEALSRFLTEFRGHLMQEEKKVVAQGGSKVKVVF